MLDRGTATAGLSAVSTLQFLNDRAELPHFGTPTDEEITERRIFSGRFLTVEALRIAARPKLELAAEGDACFLSVWMAGRVRSIRTSVDDVTISAAQDMAGKMNFVPAGHRYTDSVIPVGNLVVANFYLRDEADGGGLPVRTLAASLGRRLHFRDAAIWATAEKLTALTRPRAQYTDRYADLLSLALVEELTLLGGRRQDPGAARVAKGGLAPWQVRNIREFIEARLSSNITISDLAVLANMSESHFSRAFKKSLGVAPHRFLLLRRIERAKTLLRERDRPIGEIGASCGFAFPYSLTAAFRRITGVTPSEFRDSLP